VLSSWREASPENFSFAIKVPKAITHYKKFIGTVNMLSDFYRLSIEGLGEKLGPVLFQMAPNYHYSEERLERIIRSVDNSFLNVLEFRHESWWRSEVYKVLAEHNISFCGISHPALPNEVIAHTPLLYYRFHGDNELYASNYSEDKLLAVVKEVKANDQARQAYIFFNNDIHAHAASNARHLTTLTA
jgi:uncharacterized protein YecE (DUF72 family)